jgi:hypothetical protein
LPHQKENTGNRLFFGQILTQISVWIGGSILASLSTFQQMWISKEEYGKNYNLLDQLTFGKTSQDQALSTESASKCCAALCKNKMLQKQVSVLIITFYLPYFLFWISSDI